MLAQRLNITLPYELAMDLRRVVSEGKRSQFIAAAVEEKIKKKKKDIHKEWAQSLRNDRKLYEEIAKDWAALDTEGWPD